MSSPDYTGWMKLLYDWQTAIAGAAAILGGVIAYLAGMKQAKATRQAADQQISSVKSVLQAESILKLMDKFDSDEFLAKPKVATEACLSHLKDNNPGAEVEDVLDFFDDVAFLVKRGAIDAEMMWHSFYHWVRLYFLASEQHIIARTTEESAVWNNLRWVYPRLNELEKANSPSTYRQTIDDAKLCEWLKEEL